MFEKLLDTNIDFHLQLNSNFIEFLSVNLCSAGIGRTGTIVVIDMIIETIDTLGITEKKYSTCKESLLGCF